MGRVLVVEDDNRIVRLVARALQSDAHSVDTAATGRAGAPSPICPPTGRPPRSRAGPSTWARPGPTTTTAGVPGPVALSVTGLPAGSSATLTPNPVGVPATSTLTVRTTASTARGTFTLRVTGTTSARTPHPHPHPHPHPPSIGPADRPLTTHCLPLPWDHVSHVDPASTGRRGSFDRNADAYARWRPGYPDRLYEMLERVCGLGPGSTVLEIGPGSGQATRDLLARGARVVAVELGGNFVRQLRAEFPKVTVINADFTADVEADVNADVGASVSADVGAGVDAGVDADAAAHVDAVDLPDASFDLAVCATALHWLDAAVAVPKIARALRPGGWLAVWWTVFGDASRPTPFRERLVPMLDERLPGPPESHLPPRALQTADRVAELTAGGWFTHVETEQLRWSPTFTPDEITGLFATFPNLSELPPAERDAILAEITALAAEHAHDGTIVENYLIALYLAQARR